MKKENGVTLISIMVYIICMLIIISIIATLTSYFYKNININNDDNQEMITKYTKLNSILLTEINRKGNKVLEAKENSETGNYIVFSSGNQYTFINNNIYKNKVKIIEDVTNCKFTYKYQDSVYKVTVQLTLNGTEKILNYTIK